MSRNFLNYDEAMTNTNKPVLKFKRGCTVSGDFGDDSSHHVCFLVNLCIWYIAIIMGFPFTILWGNPCLSPVLDPPPCFILSLSGEHSSVAS